MAAERTIIIRPSSDGTAFDMVIDPAPHWAPFDHHDLPSYRAAKRKAECLRIVHGWRIKDLVPANLREAA